MLIHTTEDLSAMVALLAAAPFNLDQAIATFGPVDRWVRTSAYLAQSRHPAVARGVLEVCDGRLRGVHLVLRALLRLPWQALEQRFGTAVATLAEVDRYDGQLVHRFEPGGLCEGGYMLLHAWDEPGGWAAIQELVVRPRRPLRRTTP